MLLAELIDPGTDLRKDPTCLFQLFFMRAAKLGRIGKRPGEPLSHAPEDRAALGFCFAANRDGISEQFAGFENIEDALRFIFGNINPDFLQDFYCERIERSRFQSGALRFEKFAASLVQQRRRHLAAGAVVDANEKDLLPHNGILNETQDPIKAPLLTSQKRHILSGNARNRPDPSQILR